MGSFKFICAYLRKFNLPASVAQRMRITAATIGLLSPWPETDNERPWNKS